MAKPVRGVLYARVRDELLNLEEFSCLTEAQVLAEDWRQEFNDEHPHSASNTASRPRSLPLDSPHGLTPTGDRAADGLPPLGPRAFATEVRPQGPLPSKRYQPTDSHTRWTNDRGPAAPHPRFRHTNRCPRASPTSPSSWIASVTPG